MFFGRFGPVFSWAKVSIFTVLPESKSERIGIKSRTPFAAVTFGILESADE
jgi:hypothetical protein